MSIATVLKRAQLDHGMNLPTKFHQNRLGTAVCTMDYYIHTYIQAGRRTWVVAIATAVLDFELGQEGNYNSTLYFIVD